MNPRRFTLISFLASLVVHLPGALAAENPAPSGLGELRVRTYFEGGSAPSSQPHA
jgi:hypothetical protein